MFIHNQGIVCCTLRKSHSRTIGHTCYKSGVFWCKIIVCYRLLKSFGSWLYNSGLVKEVSYNSVSQGAVDLPALKVGNQNKIRHCFVKMILFVLSRQLGINRCNDRNSMWLCKIWLHCDIENQCGQKIWPHCDIENQCGQKIWPHYDIENSY